MDRFHLESGGWLLDRQRRLYELLRDGDGEAARSDAHGEICRTANADEADTAQPVGDADVPSPDPIGQDPFYCGERKLGTWFYCERPKPPERTAQAPARSSLTYRQRLDAIGKQLEELKAKAILEPTPDNVTA